MIKVKRIAIFALSLFLSQSMGSYATQSAGFSSEKYEF